MRIARVLILFVLLTPKVLLIAAENTGGGSLPEIKATVRFHIDGNGNLPDEIPLPASTLLPEKQRRVIEGNLGRLPIRIYVRETPNQPSATMEVNIVDTRTGLALAGYPARQEVGQLGMLSFAIPINAADLNTLVRAAQQTAKVKIGRVDRVSLHIDIDLPVKVETNPDGDLIVDCDDLLRQDDLVVPDLAEKLNDTSTVGTRLAAQAYVDCLDHQTDALSNQLKPDNKAIVQRIRSLLSDLAPVGFDSVLNENGGTYFSMLALADIGVDIRQAQTVNQLVKQLTGRPPAESTARKDAQDAFASCWTALKHLVPDPENTGEGVDVADLKRRFQSDLATAEGSLKALQEISAKLPDASAALLAKSALALLTMAQAYE